MTDGNDRQPEAALAQAVLACRAGQYDNALGWLVVAAGDCWALATPHQQDVATKHLARYANARRRDKPESADA